MRNLLIVLLIVSAAIVYADEPNATSVSTSSIKIIPAQSISSAAEWVGATNTYSQGAIVKSGQRYYMAIIGGISTNEAPIHVMGDGDTKRDGVTWRVFNRQKRTGLVVVNSGSELLSLSLGYDAKNGSGIVLYANGGSITLDDSFQGPVYAISSGTTTASSTTW